MKKSIKDINKLPTIITINEEIKEFLIDLFKPLEDIPDTIPVNIAGIYAKIKRIKRM